MSKPDEQPATPRTATRSAPRPLTGARTTRPRRHRYREFRDGLRARRALDMTYRTAVAVIGGVMLVAGIIMIPYPGPGWLVVFTALALLGTEFAWAKRLLHHGRRYYDRWNTWQRQQYPLVRFTLFGMTGVVVLFTLWMLDIGGLFLNVTGLSADWIRSPLGLYA